MDNTRNFEMVERCRATGEPFFVLRAQDCLAADLVLEWAKRAEAAGVPTDHISQVRLTARAMRQWPKKKIPD